MSPDSVQKGKSGRDTWEGILIVLCKTVHGSNTSPSNCAPSWEIRSQKNLHENVSTSLFTMTQTCKQLSLDQGTDKETVVQPDNTTLINVKWE